MANYRSVKPQNKRYTRTIAEHDDYETPERTASPPDNCERTRVEINGRAARDSGLKPTNDEYLANDSRTRLCQ